jgi:hypothetical protein
MVLFSPGGALMNRVVRSSTVVIGFAGLLAVALSACEKKGGALQVDKVDPAEGVIGGGDQVTIIGGGFVPGKTQAEVRFGRHKAEQVVISSDTKIAVIAPPGDKGPVDVTVSFDDGSTFKIPGGYKYVAPQAGVDVRKAFFSGKAGEQPK